MFVYKVYEIMQSNGVMRPGGMRQLYGLASATYHTFNEAEEAEEWIERQENPENYTYLKVYVRG